ncbi:hypothetical protein Vretimale_17211 [Volvox reticuliferus]|uniref:Peptidase S9 prolyl oligopeptidase catalytic domain-containing protein n=1 Tax=Volvox reticuliferus TaxID=1737510 RepID=A0A8J4GSR7_9CHLO|nr:hypothetical protein Vretimale_17211 [Volvox reticuliferus]
MGTCPRLWERFGEDILLRLDQEGAVAQESVDERMKLDMLAEATKIQAHVLTLHGSSDSVIPVEDAHELAARIPHHTLCVVEGADHNFRQPAVAEQLIQRVVEHLTSVSGL